MEINTKELQEKIDNGEKVIIKFGGEWCGPCRMMKPFYEKVASDNDTNVQLYSVDIDENRDFAVKYGIRSIPTIKTFDSGEVKETKVGVLTEQGIKDLVNNLLLN